MKVNTFSPDEINRLNTADVNAILKEVLPQYRRQMNRLENAFGTTTALRRFYEMEYDGVPYWYDIEGESLNRKKELLNELRRFDNMKTSTVTGQRTALNKALQNSGFEPEEIEMFRRKIGGYKGMSELFNMLEDIRAFEPDLGHTLGSDGSKFSAVVKAWRELPPRDRKNPEIVAQRAREIYEEYAQRHAEADAFPTDFRAV